MHLLSKGLHRSHAHWRLHYTWKRYDYPWCSYFLLEMRQWKLWLGWPGQYQQISWSSNRDIDSTSFEMSQPFLICWILEFLSLDEDKTKGRDTPVGKSLLNWDLDGIPCKHPWLYWGAVGMISYLANSVQPEIQMAVHQTARFSINSMQSHDLAMQNVVLHTRWMWAYWWHQY